MSVFHLEPQQTVVIHERMMLFEFGVARTPDGQFLVWLQIPQRREDGSFVGSDQASSATMEVGETLVVPFDGTEVGLPRGDVAITLIPGDGQSATIDVRAPEGWTVVDGETFYSEGYRGSGAKSS